MIIELTKSMRILSHRGYWKTSSEKNTGPAFTRSFQLGFGTETDIRDLNGELVVSHDPPVGQPLRLAEFVELYKGSGDGLPLALNIKADGLQTDLKKAFDRFEVRDYFVFDMSIPDTLQYLSVDVPVYTRESEHERQPAFYHAAAGIWMDCFDGEWMTAADIRRRLNDGKKVCLVSPELHRRPYQTLWDNLRDWGLHRDDSLMICTDYPEQAREFFHG
jgi:hypothetical protein